MTDRIPEFRRVDHAWEMIHTSLEEAAKADDSSASSQGGDF
jgi:hypothetical protein